MNFEFSVVCRKGVWYVEQFCNDCLYTVLQCRNRSQAERIAQAQSKHYSFSAERSHNRNSISYALVSSEFLYETTEQCYDNQCNRFSVIGCQSRERDLYRRHIFDTNMAHVVTLN